MDIFVRFEGSRVDAILFLKENLFILDVYYFSGKAKTIGLSKHDKARSEYYRSKEPEYLEIYKLNEQQRRDVISIMFLELKK